MPACTARGGVEARPPQTATIVSVAPLAPVTLCAGDSVSVSVPVEVKDGYHVQANPTANDFLIPLELSLERADGLEYGAAEYPSGQPYHLGGTDEILMTYAGTVAVRVRVSALAGASAGVRVVRGRLSYQACDSVRCFFPDSHPIELRVTIHN